MNYHQAVSSYKQDPSKENLDRLAEELCAAMTLREKTNLLHGTYTDFFARLLFSWVFHGTLLYLPMRGGGCRRLGIPRICFSDGPKGVVTGMGTCFPSPILRGSSFDIGLECRVGEAMAREAIAAGANYFAGICINLIRNPRGGRSQDSYTEDPFLMGEMGSRLVRSIQKQGVIACPKHLALNSIENVRFLESSNCDARTLREIYLHHFKKCVDAGALSIMASYNKVNGIFCCENRQLLTDILREEWGFEGFTMSDFMWGVHDTAGALKAGLDIEMPVSLFYNYRRVRKCITRRELTEEDVNKAVRNILRVLIRLTPGIKPQSKKIMKCREHLELAQEAAVKGMVLLKNADALLPLPQTASLAVVGPYADRVNVGDSGSDLVITRDGVTPYAGLRKEFPRIKVYTGLDPQRALAAAEQAEVAVVCIGCDSTDEGEFLLNVGKNMTRKPIYARGGDRDSLSLNPAHLELLKTLKEAGKKVIAVLYTGSVILTEALEPYTDAIVMGYYGGIRFGDALAALLCGKENFSGKLTVSIARQENDYPPFLEIGQQPYEIDFGYYNGYYLFERDGVHPAYPFGFGLSYTQFEIRDIQANTNSQGGITVSASVKNTGDRNGAEVLQVYVGSAGAAEHRPVKMLRGFERVELAPGESQAVRINIAVDDLKFYDMRAKAWSLDPVYRVYVGNSSASAAHVADVQIGCPIPDFFSPSC